MAEKRLMLLDTASLYFRAFYGVPSSVRAPDGSPINAVRGLLDFISRLVTDHKPSDLVACWDDDWRPAFRVEAIPSYKEHRLVVVTADDESIEEVPDELEPQVELIREALALIGIARVGAPGYEADDVIGTLAERSTDPCLIVTGDRDLFQLVDDKQPIRILYTASKGVGNAEVIDEAEVRRRYGVEASQYADFALLRGDSSDGLPGVRGIGDKTAATVISQYGDIDRLVSAIVAGNSGVKAAAARNILDSLDYIEAAKQVVPVVRTIDLPAINTALPGAPADLAALGEFGERWGLTNSVGRLAVALDWFDSGFDQAGPTND